MEGFTLENIFVLEFARFHDIVQGIVLNAVKEAKIEKSLQEIIEFWKVQEFSLIVHYEGQEQRGYIFGPLDDLLKVVEDHMVNLQNMAASQFVGPFLELVEHWENVIATISEVIEIWDELQQKWLYLYGIFIGQDIIMELPDLAKKYADIDKIFKHIMKDTSKKLNVYGCCMVVGRKERFKSLIEDLDKCQKSLTNYLDNKRLAFPRFHFLSDDQLLGILGARDPGSIQNYIEKMFNNLQEFKLLEEKDNDSTRTNVLALISCEGEVMNFKSPVPISNKIEVWMLDALEEMKKSHRYLIKKAVYDYGKGFKGRKEWMLDFQGMVILAAKQIWWTAEMENIFKQIKEGQKLAMKKYLQGLNNQLSDTIMLIESDALSNIDRKKLEMVTTLDAHSRDVVDRFVRDGTVDNQGFEWESQLRFYWIRDQDGLWIDQCTGSFEYAYEYMGLNERLVVTPLTERIYLTITQALSMNLGVILSGPTASGKTETIKDIAKVLGRLCIITNCTEGLDHNSIGTILGGLAQCGAWGCFDEFNRIDESVLSVISTQLYVILTALKTKSKSFMFEGQNIILDPNIGIFMTMNSYYPGRTNIPESVKSLLRTAVCIEPDTELICAVKLSSTGFSSAKILAKKIKTLYDFANKLLSKQSHYDFSLRSLKSVLHMAGQLKIKSNDVPENVLLMQALKEINLPTLIENDMSLYLELLKDLFPGLDCSRVEYSDFKAEVENTLKDGGYIIIADQIEKIVQLHKVMRTRHSTMIVGPTGGGKTVIINALCTAQTRLNCSIKLHTLNPKACTVSELYGVFDSVHRNWTDGLFSNIFRDINKPIESSQNEKNYILFDGDVDSGWIENINSVMDDNKILTLANKERIKLQPYCHLLFEVGNLKYASPATVSRAGIIYIDPKNLGYQPYLDKWINTRPEIEQEIFRKMCDKYIPGALGLIIDGTLGLQQVEPLMMIIHQTALNMVTQFCQMVDCLYFPHLNDESKTSGAFLNNKQEREDEVDDRSDFIQAIIIQSCYYSLGAALTVESRSAFDEYMKKTSELMLIEDTEEKLATIKYLPITYPCLYDYILDLKHKVWKPWKFLLPEYKHNRNKKFCRILVPTTNTLKANWYINLMMNLEKPILLVGESGSSKTAIVHNYVKSLDCEKFSQLIINFSSKTKSADVQKNIESILEKRTKDLYGPPPGKRLVIFFDDISLPLTDSYGTQQPIAFLKLLLGYRGFYDRFKDLNWKQIKDACYLAAMGSPVERRNTLDPRFVSLFSVYIVGIPDDINLNYIFSSILAGHLDIFPEEVQGIAETLVNVTLDIYTTVKTTLLPTPSKFHYVFTTRDLSKIFAGLLQSTPEYFSTTKQFLRLWRNEVTRVICDRLMNDEDQEAMNIHLETIIKDNWFDNPEAIEYSLRDPLLFGDFRDACSTDSNNRRFYEDVLDYEAVYNLFIEVLEKYNEKNLKLNLVLFNDLLDYLTRIHRALRLHNGHVLVIGVDGCGKQSAIKLASFAANYELFEISLHRQYTADDFRNEMKKLYTLIGVENKRVTFLLKNTQITDESFLDMINSILIIGVIPALFVDEEMKTIINRCRSHATEEGQSITKENIWSYFEEKSTANLRIAISMNPTDNNFRTYCKNFPGILNNTTINWIFPWPQEAFYTVANAILRDSNDLIDIPDIPDDLHKSIVDYMVQAHMSVKKYTSDLFIKHRQRNYITAAHFLHFINTYTSLLDKKRSYISLECDKLTKGLLKLAEASQSLVKLSDILVRQRKKVIEQTEKCEKLLASIDEKTKIATEKQQINKEKRGEIEIRKELIAKESALAKTALTKIQPELDTAKMALSELQKNDIIELRSFATPPELVQIVGECIVILRGLKEVSWKTAKGLMSDPGFLKSLQDMNVEEVTLKQQHMIKAHLKKSDKFNQMESISYAGFRLYKFILAMLHYCTVYREIKPKIERVKQIEAEAVQAQSLLEKEESEFMKIESQLADLNLQYNEIMFNKEKLQAETISLEGRLIIAEELINSLSSENMKWKEDLKNLNNELTLIAGNCLLSAGFLEYCGPFSHELRTNMVYNYWQQILIKKKIPLSQPYRIEGQLTNDVEIRVWNSEGLPLDEFSIQNGILTTHSSRFPLCVDPQEQALNWIKNREKKNLKIVSFYDDDFIKQLEVAINYGFPIVFRDVDYLDPIIDNVLKKNVYSVGSRTFIILGDKKVDYNHNFRIYLTTKLSNPILDPAVYSKTTVINCTITTTGLENALVSVITRTERPDVEEQREILISKINDNKIQLEKVQSRILKEISMNEGSMLDNTDLIEILENLKASATEAESEISQAEITIEDINIIRDKYHPVAERGALLFFVLTDMAVVNPMYQYALSSYIEVFSHSLQKSLSTSSVEQRLENIINIFTKKVYDYGCIGIFVKDKLLFSFQICTRIEMNADKISPDEIKFFITGNDAYDSSPENPIDWLPLSNWKDVLKLSETFPDFSELTHQLQDESYNWKKWFQSDNPESEDFPADYSKKLRSFQKLMLIRCFRIDRLYCAITNYISSCMGMEFMTQQNISFEILLAETAPTVPIMFILSPGADATLEVIKFADRYGFSAGRFKYLSLGQGQEHNALALVDVAVTRGQWLVLQNCHLLSEFTRKLEIFLEDVTTPHPDFRLWLTTEVVDDFNVGILQQSVKILTESPNGLKLKLQDTYSKIQSETLQCCNHSKYKHLIYVLAFFHAVIQERRKYNKIGWNVNYDFNDSDFNIASTIISTYCTKSLTLNNDSIPWKCFKYLLNELVYGGRIMDYYDNRIIETYMDEYFGDFLFDDVQPFHFYKDEMVDYVIPEIGSKKDYLEFIEGLPSTTSPEVLGFHCNAEISYYIQAIEIIWSNLGKMQPQTSEKDYVTDRSKYVNNIIEEILIKIPNEFNLPKIKKIFSLGISPLAIVFFQELEKFNELIQTISTTLNQLKKAIAGEIVIDNTLESISNCLYNGILPKEWACLVPTTEKSLAEWMDHFCKRTTQYTEWAGGNEPVVIWLSGLHAPETYLAALVQMICMRNNWALDKTSIQTEVSKYKKAEEIEQRLDQGCYVKGVYIEGARWDMNEYCLKKSYPKVLIDEFPILMAIPTQSHRLILYNTVKIPVYVTPNKKNHSGNGLIFEADLQTNDHISLWILQGVCLLLNLK